MKVRVIGSSGTFPTPTNPGSGYLIESGATRVWCDAGPGTFTSMPVDGDLVDAVFISHRHPDHCTDLFTAYHAWTFRPEPRSHVPLYASNDVLDHLAAFTSKRPQDAFGDTFELHPVEGGDTAQIGDLEVSFVEMSHSVPALGTRWESNGRTLFFTGDTGPGDWSEMLGGVDVLLSEAALPEPRAANESIKHLTPSEAGQIARNAGVGSLVLTHIPPYIDAEASVAAAESVFDRPVRLAAPGAELKV